jgi:hypothetical protein
MSNEVQAGHMDDDTEMPRHNAFGDTYPQLRLFGLDNEADRGRGFLTENDRRYLLQHNLTGQPERRARMRIRERILSAYFDSRFLRYISDEDHRQIFEKARDDSDLHLREAVKEFVRFTYRGLDEFNVDVAELIEHGIREAEYSRAEDDGELFTVDVDIQIHREEGPDISEVHTRFENHKELSHSELVALVNSQYTDISLIDAVYYQARQLHDSPHPPEHTPIDTGTGASQYTWNDPDAGKAEEILNWLESFFEEQDIETFEDYNIAYDRLQLVNEELADELWNKISQLSRCAPQFEEQLADESSLSTSDMALLHDILWNPENIDVETALENEVRPRTAGDDWTPADDKALQKFIARVQIAREENSCFTSGGEQGAERWNRVLELAEFDADEWSEYMQEQRVGRCATELKEWVEEDDLDTDLIHEADSWEDYWESLPQSEAQHFHLLVSDYGEDTMDAALEALAEEFDSE